MKGLRFKRNFKEIILSYSCYFGLSFLIAVAMQAFLWKGELNISENIIDSIIIGLLFTWLSPVKIAEFPEEKNHFSLRTEK